MGTSKFKIGMIIGAVGGALAGLFLAPKSGRQMREDAHERYDKIRTRLADKNIDEIAREVFDEVTVKTKDAIIEVKDVLAQKLAEVSDKIETIDYDKYLAAVKDTVENWRDKYGPTDAQVEKVKKHLEADFEKLVPEKKASRQAVKSAKPAPSKKSTTGKKS